MIDRHPSRSDEGIDPATRMAEEMLAALEAHPDHTEETRAIAFVYPNTGRGGVGLHGDRYADDVEAAVADALQSLDALLQTVGKTLKSFEVPQAGGQG